MAAGAKFDTSAGAAAQSECHAHLRDALWVTRKSESRNATPLSSSTAGGHTSLCSSSCKGKGTAEVKGRMGKAGMGACAQFWLTAGG